MRLTNMSDYAVRLLIYLGSHRDRLCTIAEIAQVYAFGTARLDDHGGRHIPSGDGDVHPGRPQGSP
mgnify:CR=1 FL=1